MNNLRANDKQISQEALKLAEGVFSYSVDLILWFTVYLGTMSRPQSTRGQLWRAAREADGFLQEINYNVIKNAVITAKKRHYLTHARRGAMPEITVEGKRRLQASMPVYDQKRVWDGRMHVITYDIPETKKKERDLLREYLRRIGCAKLQASVWLTPYNPIDTLRSYIGEKDLAGTIIVSDLGRDASIGEEDLHELIVRIYGLEEINSRYKEWLQHHERRLDSRALISYLAILKDDPQLPFDLLPAWWRGDKAYGRLEPYLQSFAKNIVI